MREPLPRRMADAVTDCAVRMAFGFMRSLGPDRASAWGSAVVRAIAPLLPVQKVMRANLREAFPAMPEAEQRQIAHQAWDNLGRVVGEYAHLGALWELPGRIEIPAESRALALRLRDAGQPVLFFSGHLGNWELTAGMARHFGLETVMLYRAPNNASVDRAILKLRGPSIGRLVAAGPRAVLQLVRAMKQGAHIAMLIDQRFGRGPRVPFFGRPASSNPLLAELARHFDCPVHGARITRLDGARFRLEVFEALELPRDAEGRIDVAGATACLNLQIEEWVRQTPGQWLWQHRRWR